MNSSKFLLTASTSLAVLAMPFVAHADTDAPQGATFGTQAGTPTYTYVSGVGGTAPQANSTAYGSSGWLPTKDYYWL